MVKNQPATWETLGSISGLGRSPGRGYGYSLQYTCLENFHGQRSLAAYNQWGHKDSDTTKRISTHTYFWDSSVWGTPSMACFICWDNAEVWGVVLNHPHVLVWSPLESIHCPGSRVQAVNQSKTKPSGPNGDWTCDLISNVSLATVYGLFIALHNIATQLHSFPRLSRLLPT